MNECVSSKWPAWACIAKKIEHHLRSLCGYDISFAMLPSFTYVDVVMLLHASTKFWTSFRTFVFAPSRKCNHESIVLTNLVKSFGAHDGMRRQLRRANLSTAGLVYLGLSRPHPCGTLFQRVAVLVCQK
jgi:hypothetical protein